jgi:hypothetical protein
VNLEGLLLAWGTAEKNEAGQDSTVRIFVLAAGKKSIPVALFNQQCDDSLATYSLHTISTRLPCRFSLDGYNGGHRRQANIPAAKHLSRAMYLRHAKYPITDQMHG